MMKYLFIIAVLGSLSAYSDILDGTHLSQVGLSEALQAVKPGTILVLGEIHYARPVSDGQVQVLETLRNKGFHVSVGMEFLAFDVQNSLDDYRAGKISEPEFLQKVGWGGSFEEYRRQILFPNAGTEFTVALNAPRSLSSKIAKNGMTSLTPDEQKLLPPQFSRGNDGYFERFKQTVGHVPADKLENYFMAQSLWDETMAWNAVNFINNHPDQVLVIIVGGFHVQYGGGLPDRLLKRGSNPILTMEFFNLHELSAAESAEELSPSPLYGKRADFIWTTDF